MAESQGRRSSMFGSFQHLRRTSTNYPSPNQETSKPGEGEPSRDGEAGHASPSARVLRSIWSSLAQPFTSSSNESGADNGEYQPQSEIGAFLASHPGDFPVDLSLSRVGEDLPGWNRGRMTSQRLLKGDRHRVNLSGRSSYDDSSSDSSSSSDDNLAYLSDEEVAAVMRERKKAKCEKKREKKCEKKRKDRQRKAGRRSVLSYLGFGSKKKTGPEQDGDETSTALASGSTENRHPIGTNNQTSQSGGPRARSASAIGTVALKATPPETGDFQSLREEQMRRRRLSMPARAWAPAATPIQVTAQLGTSARTWAPVMLPNPGTAHLNTPEPTKQEQASSSASAPATGPATQSLNEKGSAEPLLSEDKNHETEGKEQGKLQGLLSSRSSIESIASSSASLHSNADPTSESPQDTMTMGRKSCWTHSWGSLKEKARKASKGSKGSEPGTPTSSEKKTQQECDETLQRLDPAAPPSSPTSLGVRHRRRRTERMVSEAKSRHYWLGRFVTLTNAFAYEDSFHGPDPATGFEMLGAFSRPVAQGRPDAENSRVKRAFIVLENVCVTEEAAMSLRRFREVYVAQYGDRWMG